MALFSKEDAGLRPVAAVTRSFESSLKVAATLRRSACVQSLFLQALRSTEMLALSALALDALPQCTLQAFRILSRTQLPGRPQSHLSTDPPTPPPGEPSCLSGVRAPPLQGKRAGAADRGGARRVPPAPGPKTAGRAQAGGRQEYQLVGFGLRKHITFCHERELVSGEHINESQCQGSFVKPGPAFPRLRGENMMRDKRVFLFPTVLL